MSAHQPQLKGRPQTMLGIILRRFLRHRMAVLSLGILLVIIGTCVTAPMFMDKDDAFRRDLSSKLEAPSSEHIFGTDKLGRDVFAKCIYGGRVSLYVGFMATLVALILGTLLGALAGLKGGWVDNAVCRLVDVMLAIPIFFVLLILTQFFGSGIGMVTLIIGLTSWTEICRLVRAEFLTLREQQFVEAARALGVSQTRLVFRHMLPNAASPIVVAATLGMARAIIVESALSYLGFGVQPPDVSWGSMLKRASGQMAEQPWLAFFPGFLIFLTVLCSNFLGDGLRDALDPRAND